MNGSLILWQGIDARYVYEAKRYEQGNYSDGKLGQIQRYYVQGEYLSCVPHYRGHSRLPFEPRCLTLSAYRRQPHSGTCQRSSRSMSAHKLRRSASSTTSWAT